MITTFEPAAAGMLDEFHAAAKARGSAAQIISYFCADAFAAKRAGDAAPHDHLIVQPASHITNADVILMGQFSMAGAAGPVRALTDLPDLTSPEAVILEMRRRVEGSQRGVARC